MPSWIIIEMTKRGKWCYQGMALAISRRASWLASQRQKKRFCLSPLRRRMAVEVDLVLGMGQCHWMCKWEATEGIGCPMAVSPAQQINKQEERTELPLHLTLDDSSTLWYTTLNLPVPPSSLFHCLSQQLVSNTCNISSLNTHSHLKLLFYYQQSVIVNE